MGLGGSCQPAALLHPHHRGGLQLAPARPPSATRGRSKVSSPACHTLGASSPALTASGLAYSYLPPAQVMQAHSPESTASEWARLGLLYSCPWGRLWTTTDGGTEMGGQDIKRGSPPASTPSQNKQVAGPTLPSAPASKRQVQLSQLL